MGISSALEELHENNCRHNDLKPENILWFKDNDDKGTLQIADLGLAAFHEKEADTKQRHGKPTETPSGTSRTSRQRWTQNRDNDGPRSRQYDIWSMGCIMLELLVWLIYGCDAVKSFRKNTAYFWDRKGQEYRVHTMWFHAWKSWLRNYKPTRHTSTFWTSYETGFSLSLCRGIMRVPPNAARLLGCSMCA